jgi:hypothetical protein
MDLDELMASFQAGAKAELDALPIQDASHYVKSASQDLPSVKRAMHFYVGCLGLWLARHGALAGERLGQLSRSQLNDLPPERFSADVMNGLLLPADVVDSFRDFVVKYARDSSGFATDYEEELVVKRLKRDAGEVEPTSDNFNTVSSLISTRYSRYLAGDASWNERNVVKPSYVLTTGELTVPGWTKAFLETQALGSSEAKRRKQLARFWALVDYSPQIESPLVVSTLVSAFTSTADAGVMQSVFNALKAMRFPLVFEAILADAPRLQQVAWLEPLLDVWGALNHDQIDEAKGLVDKCDAPTLKSLQAATREGLKNRSAWALQVQQLL